MPYLHPSPSSEDQLQASLRGSERFHTGLVGGADAIRVSKHGRQNTGRFCLGWNGTVVSIPQPEHLTCVEMIGRLFDCLALHCLQRLGVFVKPLCWKNCCSPAVKMNSSPHVEHDRSLSTNDIVQPHTARHGINGYLLASCTRLPGMSTREDPWFGAVPP
jgi:hypothetical protein